MIGKIISHYKILEKLGAGGMGVVYKAQDTTLGRIVALKFLPPYAIDNEEDRVRFMNEAQAAAALDHPNLCTIHEISEVDGHHFIAMAFIDGQGLRELINQGPLPVDQAVDIAVQIASGLAAAHALGIVHRDIKPANIIVGKNGVVKIVDFGLAKSSISKKLTRTGSTLGTAAYMSPEQARGEPVDQRTDIWSLGAVLYELLTGQAPYSGPHEAMVIYAILNEDYTPPERLRPQIPIRLQQIIHRALSKDVRKRYANLGEMIAELHSLEGLMVTQPHKVQADSHSAKKSQPLPIKRLLIPALGVVAIAAVGGWFLLRPAKQSETASVSASDTARTQPAVTDTVGSPAALATAAPPVVTDTIPPSIAILPFEGAVGNKDGQSFATGLTGDLNSALSCLRAVRILPRQETMPYEGHATAVRTIGKALNADYVLSGSAHRDRNKLQLSAQLTKIEDGSNVWSKEFNGDVKDVSQFHGEIAKGITGALTFEISSAERKTLARNLTANGDAFDYYLRGRLALDLGTADDNEQAEKFFRKAVGSDKTFALAQIGLAQTLLQRIDADFDPDPKWVDQAGPILEKAAAESLTVDLHLAWSTLHRLRGANAKSVASARRTVALHPNDPDAHWALAVSLFGAQKSEDADRQFARTTELRPDFADPYIYRSRLAFNSGNTSATDSLLKKAVDLAPRSPRVHLEAAQQHLRRGRLADAEAEARNALQSMPKSPTCLGLLGTIELWQRKLDDAIEHLKKASEDSPSSDWSRLLGLAYRTNGKKGPAEKALRNSLRLDSEKLAIDSTNMPVAYRALVNQCLLDPGYAYETELSRLAKKSFRSIDQSERAYLTAMIFASVGKNDKAVSSLREAVKYYSCSSAFIAGDPGFVSLSSDAKFRDLAGLK